MSGCCTVGLKYVCPYTTHIFISQGIWPGRFCSIIQLSLKSCRTDNLSLSDCKVWGESRELAVLEHTHQHIPSRILFESLSGEHEIGKHVPSTFAVHAFFFTAARTSGLHSPLALTSPHWQKSHFKRLSCPITLLTGSTWSMSVYPVGSCLLRHFITCLSLACPTQNRLPQSENLLLCLFLDLYLRVGGSHLCKSSYGVVNVSVCVC